MDDWSKFASSVIPVFDAENRPVPAVIHFSSTYEQGESSSAREILKDIGKVSPLGPVPPTIGTAMSRIRKLNEQMRERAEVDERIVKKIDKNDLRIRMVGRDSMNLDGAVRELPLCCDDIHDVTPRVSALAGCDRLVSEPLVIENILVMFSPTRKKSRWGTIFPTGLERYKEPLVEPKEIG
ncbi:hypothetical protein Tco_0250346 [Tanacetum coccineum]